MFRTGILAAVALLALWSSGCGGRGEQIQAGGSTFAYPIMSKWASEYEKAHGTVVRYLSIGSGRGVEQLLEKSLDLGCTDGPLSDEELAKARASGTEIVHIPLVLGAVVPAYNLAEVQEPLHFTGQVLAEIYLGKIKQWNDPALKHLNPTAKLPNAPIAVVRRQDSSGTTYIWTEYLSRVNPEWKDRVGVGKTVNWPTGVAVPGNSGVAGLVKRTSGAIGYVELTYGLQERLAFGQVENREGAFILASPASVTAAAKNSLTTIPADLRYSINNALGADS